MIVSLKGTGVEITDSIREYFDEKIRVFNHIDEIVNEFCKIRLLHYKKRKDAIMIKLKLENEKLENKIRFIKEMNFSTFYKMTKFISENKTKKEIIDELLKRKYIKSQ